MEALKEDIEKVINNFLLPNNRKFTAFDITKILREQIGGQIRHYEVSRIVNEMYANDEMEEVDRAFRRIAVNISAFIYYQTDMGNVLNDYDLGWVENYNFDDVNINATVKMAGYQPRVLNIEDEDE
jgi:hypothetical protein